jgi:hypothetical protein
LSRYQSSKDPICDTYRTELSGISSQSLKRMYEFDSFLAEVETFSHSFRFPSKLSHVAKYDQIVITFDQNLRGYSKQKIGREISVVKVLQVDPTKRYFGFYKVF